MRRNKSKSKTAQEQFHFRNEPEPYLTEEQDEYFRRIRQESMIPDPMNRKWNRRRALFG
jgi:hypothetical protein